ncbi:unnamed protein product [Coffea canephora]|uniref:Uncharacterized protein n=1 Tax=Coffea canephora TaxID=49390 RepID=A0A068TWN6_COFCA|nr:unnamed protein product [Coffea canephora]
MMTPMVRQQHELAFSCHAGSIISTSSKPWQGPFLGSGCRNKKDAMEGKRPSGVKVV